MSVSSSRLHRRLLLSLMLGALALPVSAQADGFTAAASGDWSTASTWSPAYPGTTGPSAPSDWVILPALVDLVYDAGATGVLGNVQLAAGSGTLRLERDLSADILGIGRGRVLDLGDNVLNARVLRLSETYGATLLRSAGSELHAPNVQINGSSLDYEPDDTTWGLRVRGYAGLDTLVTTSATTNISGLVALENTTSGTATLELGADLVLTSTLALHRSTLDDNGYDVTVAGSFSNREVSLWTTEGGDASREGGVWTVGSVIIYGAAHFPFRAGDTVLGNFYAGYDYSTGYPSFEVTQDPTFYGDDLSAGLTVEGALSLERISATGQVTLTLNWDRGGAGELDWILRWRGDQTSSLRSYYANEQLVIGTTPAGAPSFDPATNIFYDAATDYTYVAFDTEDADGDGVADDGDACPGHDDYDDHDWDGSPDACDDDDDNDGAADVDDAFPNDDGEWLDTDNDGVGDNSDDLPYDPSESTDTDEDGVGDNADQCAAEDATDWDADADGCLDDTDGDGATDDLDMCPDHDDWADADGDALADGCDDCADDPENDADGDGTCGDLDICPGFDDGADEDGDGAPDGCDQCLGDPLNDQDHDGVCTTDEDGYALDACPLDFSDEYTSDDDDADGVCNSDDLCAEGDDGADSDMDGIADACDTCYDPDADGVCGDDDICVGDDAADADSDAIPDACDTVCPLDATNDADNDGVCGLDDICALGDDAVDEDGDGVPFACDVCADEDDAIGTLDDDGDGAINCEDACPADIENDGDGDLVCEGVDNCPGVANLTQGDADGDGIGDACEPDSDADGLVDDADNCPLVSNAAQADSDGDAVGDACDADDDADGVSDATDQCPGTAPDETIDATTGCSVAETCGSTTGSALDACIAGSFETLFEQGTLTIEMVTTAYSSGAVTQSSLSALKNMGAVTPEEFSTMTSTVAKARGRK